MNTFMGICTIISIFCLAAELAVCVVFLAGNRFMKGYLMERGCKFFANIKGLVIYIGSVVVPTTLAIRFGYHAFAVTYLFCVIVKMVNMYIGWANVQEAKEC